MDLTHIVGDLRSFINAYVDRDLPLFHDDLHCWKQSTVLRTNPASESVALRDLDTPHA